MRYAVCLALLSALGCGRPDIMGPSLTGTGTGKTDTPAGSQTGGGGCGTALQPTDPNQFPKCCDAGAAHCVPKGMLPSALSGQLSDCEGGSGMCVPDPLIRSGGAKPPACKSLGDAEGVCMSLCVPQVSQYKDLLPQDSCAADERCAPCINPLTNMPSGACDIGKQNDPASCNPANPDNPTTPPPAPVCPHVGPAVLDPATLPACGVDPGAHCIGAALVPATMAAMLKACPGGYCAPDPFIRAGGRFIPPTCSSLNGAEGRCLHTAIPQVEAQKGLLPVSTCAASERCVPCYSPVDGSETGACKLSCDPGPTKPKVVFSACCVQDNVPAGKCVPKTAIAETLQSRLEEDTCQDNVELCVPTEHLDPAFKPKACQANNLLLGSYTGVCLSDCLKFGIQGIVLGGGNCADNYKCVPCTRNGAPTGAPGCPP